MDADQCPRDTSGSRPERDPALGQLRPAWRSFRRGQELSLRRPPPKERSKDLGEEWACKEDTRGGPFGRLGQFGSKGVFCANLENAMAHGIVGIAEFFASRPRACSTPVRCARTIPVRQLVDVLIEVQLGVRVTIGERQ